MSRLDPYNKQAESPVFGGIERYKVKPATPKKAGRKTKRSTPRGKGRRARRGI